VKVTGNVTDGWRRAISLNGCLCLGLKWNCAGGRSERACRIKRKESDRILLFGSRKNNKLVLAHCAIIYLPVVLAHSVRIARNTCEPIQEKKEQCGAT
jgi:hypothetical protein